MPMQAYRRKRQVISPFVGAGLFQGNTNTTPITRPPSGTVPGNVLIASVCVQGTQTITPPADWTLILDSFFSASAVHIASFWKIADGVAPQSWTLSGSVVWTTRVLAFRHIDLAAPVLASAHSENVAGSVTIVPPSLSPAAKSVLVAVVGVGGARQIVPGPFWATNNTGFDRLCQSWTDKPVGPGTYAQNITINSASVYASQQIALSVVS